MNEHTTAQTQEAVEEHGSILATVGINGQLFVFQLINFAIVAAIVWFLILKPLTKKMEERKKLIDESLSKAEAIESNFSASERKFQEKVDGAKVEANKIIAAAHDEAMLMGDAMKKKAKDEIELLVRQAKKNIEIDQADMRKALREETIQIVVLAVEKILHKEVDAKVDAAFIADIVKTLDTK